MNMPYEACRAFGDVVSVRAEHIHDITEDDCRLEGMGTVTWDDIAELKGWRAAARVICEFTDGLVSDRATAQQYMEDGSLRDRFALLFCLLHGKDAWDENPVVYRVEWKIKEGIQ